MNKYVTYLKEAGNALPVEEALQIYEDVIETVEKCTIEDKNDFYNSMINRACRYASIRCDWEFMSREERMEADPGRTSAHNAFIDSLNILSRLIKSDGIETPWREQLGEERKRIGDFACFVAYITGISNR